MFNPFLGNILNTNFVDSVWFDTVSGGSFEAIVTGYSSNSGFTSWTIRMNGLTGTFSPGDLVAMNFAVQGADGAQGASITGPTGPTGATGPVFSSAGTGAGPTGPTGFMQQGNIIANWGVGTGGTAIFAKAYNDTGPAVTATPKGATGMVEIVSVSKTGVQFLTNPTTVQFHWHAWGT